MRISALAFTLALLVLTAPLASGNAQAQTTVPYPPPGYARAFQGAAPEDLPVGRDVDEVDGDRRTRPTGWHLRLLLAPGHSRLSRVADDQTQRISGPGAFLSAAVGTSLHPRLSLFGELAVGTAFDPNVTATVTSARMPPGAAMGERRRALTSVAAGAGMGLWFDRWDTQLLGSFLMSQARLVDRQQGLLLARTDFGPTIQLGLLRSWAVADRLAIGFQIRGQGARLPATDAAGAWWALGLLAGISLQVHQDVR